MVYKCLNGLPPRYLTNLFNYTADVHDYNTQNVTDNLLAAPHTALYKRSFSYYGASVWNSLPSDLRTCNNIRLFKSQLSSYLK